MKYIAKQKGFFADHLILPGESFEADDFNGKWAVPEKQFKEDPKPTQEELQRQAKEAVHGKKDKPAKKKRGRPKKSEA